MVDVAKLTSVNAHKDCVIHLADPKMPTILRMANVHGHSHHRGEGKVLNDLIRMVTVIEGRQPPTLQGREEVCMYSAEDNADSMKTLNHDTLSCYPLHTKPNP